MSLASAGMAARLESITEIRTELGLSPAYDELVGIDQIKIAILDIGFGTAEERLRSLPNTHVLKATYDGVTGGDALTEHPHGRVMAQIVWGVTGAHITSQVKAPKLYLLNAKGITNLEAAVDFSIRERVDIILYAQTWEYAGNFDGLGFLNAIVNRAVNAGIIWVNNAGNYGGKVFNSPVYPGVGSNILFSGNRDFLRFTSLFDDNIAKVTLVWNAFSESRTAGTEKDLDLIIENSSGVQMRESRLTQVLERPTRATGETFLPREEIIIPNLERNHTYRVKVVSKGVAASRFQAQTDRLRVIVNGEKFDDGIRFDDATVGQEIMVPADNPNVITVGDYGTWSAKGPTMGDNPRFKPDVVLAKSVATFTDGERTAPSTSNASAFFAGAVANLMTRGPRPTTSRLQEYIRFLITGNRLSREEQDRARLERAARAAHPQLINTVERLLGRENVRIEAGPYGDFILEVSQITPALQVYFPAEFQWSRELPRLSEWDLYLRVRQRRVQPSPAQPAQTIQTLAGYYRTRVIYQGRPSPYPWQWSNPAEAGARDPRQYVQLRVRMGDGVPVHRLSDEMRARTWRTPQPGQW